MTEFRPPGSAGMNSETDTDRGDSSVGEREASSLETLVSNPAPRSTHTQGLHTQGLHTSGRIVAAPSTVRPLWQLCDERARAFGMIGAPGGNDAEIVEANARRMVRAWNNFDAVVAFLGEIVADAGYGLDPVQLRELARALLLNLGGTP